MQSKININREQWNKQRRGLKASVLIDARSPIIIIIILFV